ncbi:hypothetical protein HG531_012479 [Fusarium graminearum]|nr:hypothetical protein HG531_012479 [Fusarium graminearum]
MGSDLLLEIGEKLQLATVVLLDCLVGLMEFVQLSASRSMSLLQFGNLGGVAVNDGLVLINLMAQKADEILLSLFSLLGRLIVVVI